MKIKKRISRMVGDGGDEKFHERAMSQTQRLYSRVKKRDERFQGRYLQEEMEKRKKEERKGEEREGWYVVYLN